MFVCILTKITVTAALGVTEGVPVNVIYGGSTVHFPGDHAAAAHRGWSFNRLHCISCSRRIRGNCLKAHSSVHCRSLIVIILVVKLNICPCHHMIKLGGFIYIATVSVIPELLEGATFRQSIMEVLLLFESLICYCCYHWGRFVSYLILDLLFFI